MNVTLKTSSPFALPDDYLTRLVVEDDKKNKQVSVSISNCAFPRFVLWSGQAYTDAGQWTDTSVSTAVQTYMNSLAA